MARITIYEVKEKKFSNKYLRQHLEKCYTIETIMDLRRIRWLEKIAKMDKKEHQKNSSMHGYHNHDHPTDHNKQ